MTATLNMNEGAYSIQLAFNRYYLSLCFFANKLINERVIAEDIVKDVFLKLWEKESDFSHYKNIKAVLYIAVKNACLNYTKKRKNDRTQTNALTYLLRQEQEDFVLNEITRAEVLREVYAAMQQLPAECVGESNLSDINLFVNVLQPPLFPTHRITHWFDIRFSCNCYAAKIQNFCDVRMMEYYGLGLCEEAELEAQMFVLAQMFIRIPNVLFSTEPAFLQNPC